MKDKLVLLVGPSGSGKTTIAKELEKEGYNIIQSYTNREPREPNEWGHTFLKEWFQVYTSGTLTGFESIEENYIDIDDTIAYFNDYTENEFYFATYEQYRGKGISIYTVDPNGAEQVRENVKDAEIVTIFLMADEKIRYERVRDREFENNNTPLFISTTDFNKLEASMQRLFINVNERIEKDRLIFATCKCDYVVDANRELLEVLIDIKEIIEQGEQL